jgi:radical SAM-linked protein
VCVFMSLVRLRYRKGKSVRFISHLDTARALRRALNRAGVAVAFSQGFSPRPKISFGPPLAVGHLSETEYVDIALAEPMVAEQLTEKLNATLPAGMEIVWAGKVPTGSPSVSAAITELEYTVVLQWNDIPGGEEGLGNLQHALERYGAAETLVVERERKGRTQRFDLKEQVPALDITSGPHGVEFLVRISVSKGGFPKPEEVVRAVFGMDEGQTKGAVITRTDVGFGFA